MPIRDDDAATNAQQDDGRHWADHVSFTCSPISANKIAKHFDIIDDDQSTEAENFPKWMRGILTSNADCR